MGLSEPKRRVKYSVDPNALRWANDESKFGKRLMEKMGWQQGEGLGAKSDGMTEHIKVKFKSDTKGVGYNNNDYDNVWLDHQDDFESVLASLKKGTANKEETTTETDNKPAINPLVQKSKERSKRLHYSKFTKSKDLSMASQHDLACILGTDKRTKLKQEEKQDTTNDKSNESDLCFAKNPLFEPIASKKRKENKESVEVSTSESQILFKTNTLSISDYFAQKMKSKLNKIKSDESSNDSSSANEVVEQPVEEQVEPKKKKKKSKHDKEETCEEEQKQMAEIEERVEVESESKKKKKKKSKNNEEQNGEEVVVVEEVVRKEHVETTTKKKKKKSKDKEQVVEEVTTTITETTEVKVESKLREDSFPDAIITDKSKKAAKKRQLAEKNLEKDPKFYEMSKKPSATF